MSARLADAARLRGFPGDARALETLRAFLAAVVERGRSLNLTSATTLEEAVDVLALSAFAVAAGWPPGPAPALSVDLGSGNGFPGVVTALAWPSCRVLLVERRKKKADAVAECLRTAGIGNAETVACDGRELVRERPEVARAVDLVTARAVGSVAEVNRMAAPWLSRRGRILHWKGEAFPDEERQEALGAARSLGLRALPEIDFGPPPPGPARLVLYERDSR